MIDKIRLIPQIYRPLGIIARSHEWVKKSVDIRDFLRTSLWNAGTVFNKVTGYENVQKLKDLVIEKEQRVSEMRREFQLSKLDYEQIIEHSRQCQKDLDHLRDRKRIQSIEEINSITKLYERQLELEEKEKAAKIRYLEATHGYEKAQTEYLDTMRERYVEEQMFSDKIRQSNTFWTMLLMSIHLILFIIVQFFIEPRKRANMLIEFESMIQNSNPPPVLIPERESQPVVEVKSVDDLESPGVLSNVTFWQGISLGAISSSLILAFLK